MAVKRGAPLSNYNPVQTSEHIRSKQIVIVDNLHCIYVDQLQHFTNYTLTIGHTYTSKERDFGLELEQLYIRSHRQLRVNQRRTVFLCILRTMNVNVQPSLSA